MILAVCKARSSNKKSVRFVDKYDAITLLDTETLKIVSATTESILRGMLNGSILIDNLRVVNDDLVETEQLAFVHKVLGDKANRIIYKDNNLVVVQRQNKFKAMLLDRESAEDLEKRGARYDVNIYGGVDFKATDIEQKLFTEETKEETDTTTEDAVEPEVKSEINNVTEQETISEVKQTLKDAVNDLEKEDNDIILIEDLENIGDDNCEICKGKGRYKAGLFGLIMTCDCVARKKEREAAQRLRREKEELVYKVTGAQKIQVVAEKLVPEARKDDEFSEDILKEQVMNLYSPRNGSVRGRDFSEYVTLLNSIIAGISIGEPLKTSYMIGAPNGFGKTTFANTCIKRLYAKGKKAVPYRSLLEISALRDEYIKQMGRQYRKTPVKIDEDDYTYEEKTYTWDDYCKAEIVFCYLTIPDNGWVEMNTLKALTTIRATNGLATVVMMDSSLQVYKANNEIKKYILDDILADSKEYGALDRLVHQSVYIIYRTGLDVVPGKDF